MKVKIDDFLKQEFNKITVPHDFSSEIIEIFEEKKYSNTSIYKYFQIVACVSILLIGLSTFYIINTQRRDVNNTSINVNTENNASTENNTNKTNEKYNDRQPYKVIAFSSSKSYDVTDVKKLYKNVDLIVTGKVIEKKDAEISKIIPTIHTPGTLTVFNVIKGSVISNNINFIVIGGKISLEDYENTMKNIYPDTLDKEGISKLDINFKQQNYILCKDEYSNDFYNKQEYVMFLNKIEGTDEYAVASYAGMIPVDDSSELKSIEQIFNLEKVKKD